jgi:hypothetical protein
MDATKCLDCAKSESSGLRDLACLGFTLIVVMKDAVILVSSFPLGSPSLA